MMAERPYQRISYPPIYGANKRKLPSVGSSPARVENTYIVQYTSVILILFTVAVGSLATHPSGQLTPSPPLMDHQIKPPLSTLSIPYFTVRNSQEADHEQLNALAEFINRHDICVRLILPLNPKQTEQGFRRFQLITSGARELGIPADRLSVKLDEKVQGDALLIVEHAPTN